MKLIKISEKEFCSVYSEMEKNFIADERRDPEAAKSILEKKEYKIYHTVEAGERVGFVTVWELSGFAFIEHFVTYEKYRNKGYGSKVLDSLKEKYGSLVLEAEPPQNELQKRRIAFYERNGFCKNPQKYIQPPYQCGGAGVELVLMSYPEPLASRERTVREIYGKVYNTTEEIVMKERLEKMGFSAYGALPNSRQMEWYRRGMTAFIHFGMNTFMGNEWGDGTEDPRTFNPTELDCRQWISFLKEEGFGSVILTAKHHDGFCLWPSKYTEHSVKNSAYKDGKGDIVREFTDACREFGMKAGIYLSPWDRHEKTWGKEEYNDFYVNQLTELLSNYGEIWEVWWDGAGSTEAHYDWDRWGQTVRRLQPNAVIFGSLGATPYVDVRWVGNEKGIAGQPCWATIDPSSLETETMAELNAGKLDGARFIPAEADVSIRPGWFYKASQDDCVRTPANLFKLWASSLGRNAGWLLNFPPDRRGLIHENDIASFKKFKEELAKDLEIDYAKNAKITASSIRSAEFAPEKLTDGSEDSFYAPEDGCLTPELVFELDGEHEINGVVFGEMIELGHHIRGYEIDAMVDGEWKTVASGECVGYKCAAMFDTVTTAKLRLRITEAAELPLLRNLGIYRFADRPDEMQVQIKGKNLLENEGATVIQDGKIIDINLGGVFPFNCIKLVGTDLREYEIKVFNGTDFVSYGKYEAYFDLPVIFRFDPAIDWAYRIQIVMRESSKCKLKKRPVEVYFE